MARPLKTQLSAREKALNAAEDMILREGAALLRLDAVAKAAGISKGGLMHHFPTKEALLEGIMHRVHDYWMEELEVQVALVGPGPGRHARALANLCFMPPKEECRRAEKIFVALATAHAHHPALMDVVRGTYQKMIAEFDRDGLLLGRALLALAALDGLFWANAFNLYSLSERQRKLVRAEIDSLLSPPESAARPKPEPRQPGRSVRKSTKGANS
jgi:AcrR family transcriptional regulator